MNVATAVPCLGSSCAQSRSLPTRALGSIPLPLSTQGPADGLNTRATELKARHEILLDEHEAIAASLKQVLASSKVRNRCHPSFENCVQL